MAGQFNPFSTIAGVIHNALTTDSARNQQMNLAYGLTQQGVHPQDAARLSGMLAYHPYNSDPNVQAQFLQALKSMGYLRQQAL